MVCIIDDDDAVRDSVRAVLEAYGIEVKDYASARAFLTDSSLGPRCCLLVDLHMPEMTGIELLEHLQEHGLVYPAIVITGRSDSALRQRAQHAGAFALLDKPVDVDILFDTISAAMDDAAAPAGLGA